MSGYRKLSRTAAQRKALLRNQVTMLLYNGKIVTTEAKAKEVRRIAEGLIALAVKEKDNFETVTVKAKVARKDANGKRVKEVVDGKRVTVFDEVEKEIQKDLPSRMNARRSRKSRKKARAAREIQSRSTWSRRCSKMSLRSMLVVTAVTHVSSRSVSARATAL